MNKREFIISYRENDTIFERHITKEENNKIDLDQKFLEKLRFQLWRIIEIDLNYQDLIVHINRCEKESHFGNIDFEKLQTIFINTNRLFTNFVTSFKYLIDFIEDSIENHYSVESSEFERFEKFKTYNYETYFSYRLFYNLRNYCQHKKYPIYNFSEDKYYFKGNVLKKELKIEFNKKELMKDKDLRRQHKYQFQHYGDTFPVKPLLKEILIPISKLESLILKIFSNDIQEVIKFIKTIQEDCTNNNVQLRYGEVTISNRGIRHLENKILEYKFAIELENKLNQIE